MARKRTGIKLKRIEKLLYSCAVIALVLTVVSEVFLSAKLGNIKMEIEKNKYEISLQDKKNESLTMKVNELTSFDNIRTVVKDMGFAYNRNNVINIED